jgi:hypothetical protein
VSACLLLIISRTHSFCSNEELLGLQVQHVARHLVTEDGQKYIKFKLVFQKTNKEASNGER